MTKHAFGSGMIRRSMVLLVFVGFVVMTQLKRSISITNSKLLSISKDVMFATHVRTDPCNNEVKNTDDSVIKDMTTIYTTDTKNFTTQTLNKDNNSGTGNKSNRTLVIMLGSLRGGETAWKSMFRHVLDVNMADLALLIGEGQSSANDNSNINNNNYYSKNASTNIINKDETTTTTTVLHTRAKFIWTIPEYDDWADAMEDIPDKPDDWRDRLFGQIDPSANNILLGAAYNISGSGALVFMFRFYLSQKLQQHNLLSSYDRFVITRSDHFYLCAHDLSQFSNEFLWVPTGSDHNGICDRHFIASNETILKALDILPPLVQNPESYQEQLTSSDYNTERFLLLRWEQEGLGQLIQRFDRNMFIVATEADTTRWQGKERYIKRFNAYLKYTEEFEQSKLTCWGSTGKNVTSEPTKN
jgi:hypothetical protein